MNDLPKNELFSAYLDGELTAAERTQVEQLLATDPAARQLLDELRAVSNTLQSLPKQKVGEDLGPHVLRMAERRILTDQQPESSRIESAPVPLGRAIFRRFTSPRILVWTAITTVFAIVVCVDEQRRGDMKLQPNKEVAMAPRPLSGPLPPSSIAAAPAKNKNALDGMEPSQRSPSYMQEDVSYPNKEASSEKSGKELAKRLSPKSVKSELTFNEQPPLTTANKPSEATQDAAKSEESAQTPANYAGGKQSGSAIRGSTTLEQSASSTPASPAATASLATAAKRSKSAELSKSDDVRFQVQTPQEQNTNDEVVVVECDISPEAVKNQAFDKLLLANSIVLAEGPQGNVAARDSDLSRSVAGTPTAPPASQSATSEESKDKKSLSEESRSENKPKSDLLARSPKGEKATLILDDKVALKHDIEEKPTDESRVGGASKPAENKMTEEVDVIYVEATPDQVEATLADMAAKPEEFPAMSVQLGAGQGSDQQIDKQQAANNTQQLSDRYFQYNRVSSDVRQGNQQAVPQQAGQPSNSAQTAALPEIRFSERNQNLSLQKNQSTTQGFAQRVQATQVGGRWTLDIAQSNNASNRQTVVFSQKGNVEKSADVQNSVQTLNRNASPSQSNRIGSTIVGDDASPVPANAAGRQSGEENSLRAMDQNPPMQRVVFVLRKVAPSAPAKPASSSPSDRPQDAHP